MHKALFLLFLTAALSSSGGAIAQGKSGKNQKNIVSHGQITSKQAQHCPPGLAKKAIPCVPPGQAKQRYFRGDRIIRDFERILDPYRWGLDVNQTYYRSQGYLYSVDPSTEIVLRVIGLTADILR